MDEVFECSECGQEVDYDGEICQECEEEANAEEELEAEYNEGVEYAGKIMRHLNGQTQSFKDGFNDNFDY